MSKSVKPPSWKSCIQRLTVPLLQTAIKQTGELESVVQWHVRIADLQVRVWFDVVNKLAVDIPAGASSMNRYVSGILHSLQKLSSRPSRSVYISPIERKNKSTRLSCHE